ncbi:hypothetical protein HZB74_03955 [Candidatus Saccharibacteria bacterium]|nr:hypothetical protein [Candidatus Saccharibacteria bacterium]
MSKILKSRKFLVLLALLIVVGAVAAYAYNSAQSDKEKNTQPENSYTESSKDQEKSEAETNKANVDKRADLEKQASQTSTTKKTVSVVITNAQADSITSYVSGVFEDGGTCTATITKGSSEIIKTSKGFKDATHTTCAPIFLKSSDFPSSGTWAVKMSYSSSTSEGQSQTVNIEVR